jgi:hypothetical protein
MKLGRTRVEFERISRIGMFLGNVPLVRRTLFWRRWSFIKILEPTSTTYFANNFHQSICLDRPPLWSSGQSSCLQIQRSEFDCRRYQIFWGVVGLERGPLSLVSTTEDLLGRKSSGFWLESREYGPRGSATLISWHHLYAKVGTNSINDKRRPLGRYSSLADSGQAV